MDKIDIIKKTITELLKIMNFNGEVFIDASDEDNILVNIQSEQASYLIGQAGANLDAMQYIARVLVSKKTEEPIKFLLDVNNYRKNRIDLLREMAKNIAKQASIDRVSVTLHPMSAYERRIIHLALVDYPQVNTESIGYEPERRVVVKPLLDK